MDKVAAVVLAGGRGMDFGALSAQRTKAALPICGQYRIIDFVLSNLSQSGIRRAGIVIQYLPASLIEHVSSGFPWGYGSGDRRLSIMTPFVGIREIRWFNGSADAVAKNINLFDDPRLEDVLILSGDHVYRMDYRELIKYHRQTQADVTFACINVPIEQQHARFGIVHTDESSRVVRFQEKPNCPPCERVSMGIYVFKRSVLLKLLEECGQNIEPGQEFRLAADVLEPRIDKLNARAWTFDFPWFYISDLKEYHQLHMDIASGRVNLFWRSWDIMTNFNDRDLINMPPALISPSADIDSSIISPGCRIHGRVVRSVVSPNVTIGKGTEVVDSVIFHDAQIGEDVVVHRAILDKDVKIDAGARIGSSDDNLPITVLPKAFHVEPGREIHPEHELPIATPF